MLGDALDREEDRKGLRSKEGGRDENGEGERDRDAEIHKNKEKQNENTQSDRVNLVNIAYLFREYFLYL